MKKKTFTSSLFCLLLGLNAVAQQTTIRVQGAPRKVSNTVAARIEKAADATSSTAIDFDKIQRWTGSGDCRAALAIKWADGQNDGKTLVWGYRWNSSEQKTGEDLIRAVAKADPAFYMMADPKNAYGFTIGGLGYDADADRLVSVTTMEAELYPRNGLVSIAPAEFETSAATDWGDGDSWNCGWYSGFWSYYTADSADDALQMAATGAAGRSLTDGCVDAYVFGYFDAEHEANTYDGNLDYLPATADYTTGAFTVNEDWFGHRNSTTNYLADDGQFVYNNTADLGCTACFGAAWGNRYYIISKQAKDAGAENEGGRITICDANTMHTIKQIRDIDGKDGRSFCGVDEHKAYVSTTGGIYTLDLDNMEVGSAVKNADGEDASLGQCGNMIRLGDYVYAVEYGKSLHVIDPSTDRIVATIGGASCYSITLAKDGSLWVSTAEGIARVNTATQALEKVALPQGISIPANSAWAWTADGLCSSLKHNVIYWTAASGWSTTSVFSYDIDNDEFAKVIDLTGDKDNWVMYTTSNLRVAPASDELYVSLFKSWGETDYAVRRYAADGTLLAQHDLEEKNYWFPGMFVFPDAEDPTVAAIDDIAVEAGKTASVDLSGVADDADNFQAAITKSVESVADESVATATVKDGKLVVEGVKNGSTAVTLKFCSNGITATANVNVSVSTATGINAAENAATDLREVARFTADGRRIQKPQQGVNIVKFSDGTTRKVVVE